MAARIIALLFLLCGLSVQAQVTSDVKDIQVAKQRLQVGTDAAKYITAIAETISAASTHRQGTTAKAVYDYIQTLGLLDTIYVSARLTGAGTTSSRLDIAQQGATTGQVLRWSGTAWAPNGINLYDIVTTSQTVGVQYNQVWVGSLSAGITLNLPACNTPNSGVKIEIVKSGSDSYPVTIEPAGSETFQDGETSKILYSQGRGIACTCNAGAWLFFNL